MARHLLILLISFTVFNAAAQDNPVVHTLFFIGDCGEPEVAASSIGSMLRAQVQAAGGPATVLYLGDNIYPKGLSPNPGRSRQTGEQVIRTQAGWIRDLPNVQGIMVPGNHDWQRGGPQGLAYILEEGRFADSLGQHNFRFLPQNGCPGPVEIPLGDNAVLVIVDTQWLLHPWDKPGAESTCEAKTTAEVLTLLEDVFRRHARKRVIVAAHHPPITYGEHGGVATVKDHIFPLTQLSENLYVPLPGIGSLYPLYRKWFGNIQDVQHPVYKAFSEGVQGIMARYPGSVFAAGHEHALEYIVKDSMHMVVSGSGSKTTFVRRKKYARLAASVNGFAALAIHANGLAVITYWQVDPAKAHREVLFADSLHVPHRLSLPATPPLPDLSAGTVRVKASDQYHAGKTKMKLFGANYRAEWATELDVPFFDIGTEQGGLKILQKGGGQQTLSLRLTNANGREYVLRSVEKYPENAVPEAFRKTFAQDLVQDQISASHPYAALVIPPLAAAAGIYHTNPRLVYIPDDPRLGEYQKEFANTLALFEERPAGSWTDAPYFGNSGKIVNTTKVLEKLQKDNDNQVDQEFVLRSRIFDLWIGDWDRHDDQWRWATLESKKSERYRPIPRDRDQAFFLNEGKISRIWGHRWAFPKFEGFKDYISWPSGLSFNARYFDRSFLTGLSEEQWIAAARELERVLTDSVIERSIRQWPPQIMALHGERIIHSLKARRANLVKYAIEHYRFLAREVDVTGSDKAEWFTAERHKNGDVLVTVFNINKEEAKGSQLYQRLFKPGETREVRLFAQGGDDRFELTGDYSDVLIRIIGGDGKDRVSDQSRDARQTMLYDRRGDAVVEQGNVKDRTSNDPQVNVYDRRAFKYDKLVPLIFGNFNPDDGVFIGGGFMSITQGFRKAPFKTRHFFLATVAPLTGSYNFRYQGKFTQAVGRWDFDIDFNLKAPNYVNNFFGLGNETIFDREAGEKYNTANAVTYYRFRFEELLLDAGLSRPLGSSANLRIGPVLQRIEVEEPTPDQNRYIGQEYAPTLPYPLFEEVNTYAGVAALYVVDKRDHPMLTTRGINITLQAKGMAGLDARASSFGAAEGSFTVYQSFRLPARVVFAWRVGGGHNFGSYEFYQAQILSGKTELRGFRKTRFYGDSKVFSNLEMRVKLANIKSYLFPASLGILAFNDVGRVWYEDASGIDPSAGGKSDVWHSGFGGGVWFTPFNLAVLSVEAGHSKEGTLGYVRLGFLF